MAFDPWDEFESATPAKTSTPAVSSNEWDEFESAEPTPAPRREPRAETPKTTPAPRTAAKGNKGPTAKNAGKATGQSDVQKRADIVETTQTIGGFADELPTEPAAKLTDAQIAEYVELASNPKSTANDLRAWAAKYGRSLDNADEIVAARKQNGPISKSFNYHLPKVEKPSSTGEATALGFGRGASFEFLDELGARADALGLTGGRQNVWNSDLSWDELVANNTDMNRAILGEAQESHPYATLGGQFVGSLATLPATGCAATAINAGRIGRGAQLAVEGAAVGGLTGAGAADEGDRITGALGGAALGAATTVVGDRVLGGLARQSGRDAAQGRAVLDAADDLNARFGTNIRPVAANVGGRGSQMATGGSEQTILGGLQLSRAADNLVRESGDAARAISGDAAPLADTGEEFIRRGDPNSLINLPQRLEARWDGLYARAGQLAGNVRLQTPRAIAALDQEIRALEEVPGGVAGLQALRDLRTSLANGGTVNGLRRLRTSFGDSLDAGNRTVREASRRLWGPLSDDIFGGLERAGRGEAARAFRRADTAFRNARGHIEAVESLLEGKSGQQVAAALSSMSRGDDHALQNILRLASPDEARAIQGGIVQQLGRATNGAQDATGNVFSLETFLTNFGKMSDSARARIFQGQLRTDLTNLARVAVGARRGRTFRNVSRSGGALNFQTVLRTLDGFATYGSGGKSAIASGTVGFLLSSPRVARTLVWWGETGASRAAVIERLSRVAGRMTGSQGSAAVNAFTDYLSKEDAPAPATPKGPTPTTEELREDQFDHIDENAFGPEEPEDDLPVDDGTDEEPLTLYDEDGRPLT